MNRRGDGLRRRAARALGACLVVLAAAPCAPSRAADVHERWPGPYGSAPMRPDGSVEAPARYFPRSDGDSTPPRYRGGRQRVACTVRQVPIPTDAPDDPSYVGSTYGLGKPSYYGIRPALGVDDPFGCSLLPYCN